MSNQTKVYKNKLSDTHARVLSVILKIIETDLNEILNILSNPYKGIMYDNLIDIGEDEKKEKIGKINKILIDIEYIYKKFSLKKESLKQSKMLDAKKSKLWSILEDSYSKKLSKYGEMDYENSQIIDPLIKSLIEKIGDI